LVVRSGRPDRAPRQVFVSRSTLAAPAANDFDENHPRQLRRLLRSLNIATTDTDPKPELLQELRFHVDCDDALFDNSKMPATLQRYQILQACMHLLMCVRLRLLAALSPCRVPLHACSRPSSFSACPPEPDPPRLLRRYFFAPCTRALETYWLCRKLAGSGDPGKTPSPSAGGGFGVTGVDIGRSLAGDPQPEYRETYLKDDMSRACWSGEHLVVLAIATLLWLAYAVGFPLAMACVIAKDKAAAGRRAAGADQGSGDGGSQYWHSTRPLVEKYWLRPGLLTREDQGCRAAPLTLTVP
jgi:hypothetical protein